MTTTRRLLPWACTHASTVRVSVAFAGVMLACGFAGQPAATIPLLLGVIASALAETDDNWRSRLNTQVATLCCFALLISAVQSALAVRAVPALLTLVFAAAAFILTLAGALGERYRLMTTATLIMGLYAAIATQASAAGANPSPAHAQQMLLMAGAAWHGLISVLAAATLPMLPVDNGLARLYTDLGRYLELKAELFEPVRDIDREQRRLALAQHNGRVVDALNASKETLLARAEGEPPRWLRVALYRFFVAQDIHERTSSSHENYALLAETFFHSDVLYRCQRLLALLGADCRSLAEALNQRQRWTRGDASARALADLDAAIAHLEAATPGGSAEADTHRARRALRLLAGNLAALSREVDALAADEYQRLPLDSSLQDIEPRTLADFGQRLRAPLTLASPLMRHAIRLSVALAAGHALMHATGDAYGFWILLTIVFVCQPYYGATLTRLAERIAGTVAGLAIGWALLRLFSDPLPQAAFIVVAAVAFFAWRTTRYLLATAGITIFVLLALNQIGNGYGLIVPRLLDTLTGSAIAGLAVWLILPSWNSRRLPGLAAQALRAQARYFGEIMAQYGIAGRDDNLAYRIARRDAHNADAALSAALTAARREPVRVRGNSQAATRLLLLEHTLLNYLSALGAHRDAKLRIDEPAVAAAALLRAALEDIARALAAAKPIAATASADESAALRALAPSVTDEAESHRVVRAQLGLSIDLLPALRAATNALVRA